MRRKRFTGIKMPPGYTIGNGHQLRHFFDHGVYYASFVFLLDKRTWRRHPAPFNKTTRGRMRRDERLHRLHIKTAMARAPRFERGLPESKSGVLTS